MRCPHVVTMTKRTERVLPRRPGQRDLEHVNIFPPRDMRTVSYWWVTHDQVRARAFAIEDGEGIARFVQESCEGLISTYVEGNTNAPPHT